MARLQGDVATRELTRLGAHGKSGRRRDDGMAIERIPILKLSDFLLITIQVEMYDSLAQMLLDDLAERIVETRTRGVLIDISALEIVDSYMGRMLSTIAETSRLLDAETVVVGMQPAVAITLVQLGLSLPGIKTALAPEQGMDLLHQVLGQSEPRHDRNDSPED
jgi:rsbT antagonist protein RsbS